MSINGSVLNDSHAEIVSRRCFMKYLYAQLELHFNPGKSFMNPLSCVEVESFEYTLSLSVQSVEIRSMLLHVCKNRYFLFL